jgi:hypothetical protein
MLHHSGVLGVVRPERACRAGSFDESGARSKSVLQTIILATCLIGSPSTCKEIHLQVASETGASLQLPYHCARQGQIEVQKWISEHPEWRVEKWSCPPAGRVGQQT